MKITSHDTQLRYGIAIAIVGLLLVAIAGVGLVAAEVASSSDVYLDDPDNETVEVDVDYSTDDTDATAELLNESGDVVDDETITADDGDSETFALEPGDVESGDYEVNISVDDPDNETVEADETRLIAERDVTVEDAENETLAVDAGFASDENATASVAVDDEDGTELLDDSIEYDAGEYDDNETVITREYNASDGVEDGNLTVSAEFEPASAYDGAWASVDSGADGIFGGGTIAGQSVEVVIAVVAIGIGLVYARREDYI